MKILYGVVGEGMGHAIRSSVVLEKLIADGHDVHIVVSGRAHGFLQARFPDVSRIWGVTMAMEDNEVRNRLTLTQNLKGALKGFPQNISQYFEVETKFEPDVVISDFETWSWLFAKRHRLPLICIDNIQIMNRCSHSEAIVGVDRSDFKLARNIVRAKCPGASHYLVTTFFYPELRKKRTTLVPPILRENILSATPTKGDHLLVYQTSETFEKLPRILRKLDRPVLVYGLRKVEEDVVEDNITYRPFSEDGFVADLASAAGVIASAGFTLLGESVHLQKPYLATPVRKQFEQLLNARYLTQLGYGTYDTHLDEATIRNFIDRLPEFSANLESYERKDNSELFTQLDLLLDKAASGLLKPRLIQR